MTEQTTDSNLGSKIRDRWDSLVKPPGSLGDLEDIVIRLGEIQGTLEPEVEPGRLLLFAGDHGVTEESVSAYPSSVTARMIETIRDGGAAINSLCDSAGLDLEWYNVGSHSDLVRNGEKFDDGTANMTEAPALSDNEVHQVVESGREALRRAVNDGTQLVALGEIGIGNTTASSAVVGAVLDCDGTEVVGPGSGVEGDRLERKKTVVNEALEERNPDPDDGYDVLASVGGYELAAQVGVILEAHERDVPVLLDGFITGASALAARQIEPASRRVLLASHCSQEPAHGRVLAELDLEPMTDFNLRLGEGSGAALVYPLLKSALTTYRGMYTFEEAGIGGGES